MCCRIDRAIKNSLGTKAVEDNHASVLEIRRKSLDILNVKRAKAASSLVPDFLVSLNSK